MNHKKGGSTLIEIADLPKFIIDAINSYQKNGEKFDVFPSKFYIDGNYYYYVTFLPSSNELIIREDGVVPTLEDIKKVALTANGYNTSIQSIIEIGQKWANSANKSQFQDLLRLLEKIRISLGSDAPIQVQENLISFVEMAEKLIEEQENLVHAVQRGKEIIKETNDKEVTTEEDRKQLRICVESYIRASHNQNGLQLQNTEARDRVMEYLSSKRWSNPKLLFYYPKLARYHKSLLTWDKMSDQEKKSRENVEQVLESDDNIEEIQSANEHVKRFFRNPRTG